MFVSFTMFCEAAALVPQLVHLHESRDTDGLNNVYIGCLGLARISRIFFWWTMANKRDSFWYLMLADLLHSGLICGFFYLYRKLSSS